MIDAVRSEWVKLRSVTSTIVLFIAVAGVSVGFGLLATAIIPFDDEEVAREVGDRLTIALSGVGTALTLLSVIGILLITQEFRFNTLRVTFTAVPRRSRVLAAKAVVLALAALVVGAVMVALTTAIGALVLSIRGFPIDFGDAGTTRVLVGAVVLAVLHTLAGLAIGAIVRAQALAIVLIIVWPLVIEGIVGVIFPGIGKWLPFLAASQLLVVRPDDEVLDPWVGAAYLGAVVLAALVVGAALLRRRDA